mgnify:CR=1 FL=1
MLYVVSLVIRSTAQYCSAYWQYGIGVVNLVLFTADRDIKPTCLQMQTLAPVSSRDREVFMDVLRGFSILGIFIANLHSLSWYNFTDPAATGSMLLPGTDRKVLFLHHMFIEGKFYSIFSFLFGWGMIMQLKGADAKGVHGKPIIRRRLFFMLLLGAMHLMFWPGDIVFFYALLGFILLPLTRLHEKKMLITGVVLLLSPILLYWLKMHYPLFNMPAQQMYAWGEKVDKITIGVDSDESFRAFIKSAGWPELFKAATGGFFYRYGDLFMQSRIPKVLGMMLIGAAVGKSGFYRNLEANRKSLYIIIAAGLLVGLPANYILAHYMDLNDGSYYKFQMNGFYRTLAYALGVAPLAAVYIATFMLLFRRDAWRKKMLLLAPVGRMAFSNYISHTLIGNFIFFNAGLGYMGTVGPLCYTLLALVVFMLQIIASTIWLKYFNYGPLEWIWRSATYKKRQPFIKDHRTEKSG